VSPGLYGGIAAISMPRHPLSMSGMVGWAPVQPKESRTMADFADRMKTFTDHLKASIDSRGEALSRVHAATEELLGDARTFLGNVTEEHQTMARELRETMDAHREDRTQKVAEMRNNHQASLRAMREDLNHMLSETHKTRCEDVNQLCTEFRETRHALAKDLSQAASAWREFAASR
jgi:gas vesicle protein